MEHNVKKSLSRLCGALLCGMLFLCGCAEKKSYVETAFTNAVDSLFSGIIDENGPGAMVIITHGDSTLFSQGYGLARLDKKIAIDENTLFSLASATKLSTAIGVMKLADEGCVSLGDSLSKFFPSLSGDIYDKVKLKHVLSGSSGLPNKIPDNPAEWEDYCKKYPSVFYQNRDFSLYGDDVELTRFFEGVDTLLYEPGTSCQKGLIFSDPPFMLMTKLIEEMTHTDFSQWMYENVLRPGGVEHACYSAQDVEKMANMSHGYVPAGTVPGNEKSRRSDDGKWEEYDYGEVPFFSSMGDSGLFMSAKSYKNWRRKMLAGNIITPASVDSIYHPWVEVPDIPSVYHGLGVIVINRQGLSQKRLMRGYRGGYSTAVAWFPKEDMAYMIFMNRNDIDVISLMRKMDRVLARHGFITWLND